MKQTARIISIYAADTSGVCSALYELGGMTIVHDASGCNSTYSTHDEPRWYQSDSMIYISGLTENDAVMGNDEKLIEDIISAARDLTPEFITLCGAPVPMMVGTDFDALAVEIASKTGIPTFGLHTNGMHSYLSGASSAFCAVAGYFCSAEIARTSKRSLNILGATPLDFSITGMVNSMKAWTAESGFELVDCMAMGSPLEALKRAGSSHVNLVVSSSGFAVAELLRERFGTPWVAGVPIGKDFSKELLRLLNRSAEDGVCRMPCSDRRPPEKGCLAVVGESIFSGSLARALELETWRPARVLCPLETDRRLLAEGDVLIPEEEDAEMQFPLAEEVVADPLYAPICPVRFHRLPHEAFSGRCFRKEIPNLINQNLERSLSL